MTARPTGLDLRLALPATTAWGTAAVTQSWPVRSTWLLVAAAVAGCMVSAMRGRRVVAGLALGVAVGAAAMGVRLQGLHRGPTYTLAQQQRSATLALSLTRDPTTIASQSGRSLVVADATATAVRTTSTGPWQRDRAPVVVFAAGGSWLGLLPGQRLVVDVRLRPPRVGDTVSAVVLTDGRPQLVGAPPPVQRWAGRVRDALRTACQGLGSDERALVPGLVLGDVSAMPSDLTAAFRTTGLTHLMAVSGTNVAIVLGAVSLGVRRLGAGPANRVLLAAGALLAFVVLVRPAPSVLRAAVMGAVVLLAALLGRRASPVPLVAAAVLLLIALDPFLARTPGFAMSVLATVAIVVLAPRWTERLSRRMPRPVAAALAVPAAAQLACTPVIVAVFGQLTPLAVPANLLAAPAVAPATLIGIAAALLAVVTPGPASVVAWLAGLPAGWLAGVARTLSALPGAGLTAPRGWPGVGLLAALALAGALVGRGWRRRARRVGTAADRAMLDTCRP